MLRLRSCLAFWGVFCRNSQADCIKRISICIRQHCSENYFNEPDFWGITNHEASRAPSGKGESERVPQHRSMEAAPSSEKPPKPVKTLRSSPRFLRKAYGLIRLDGPDYVDNLVPSETGSADDSKWVSPMENFSRKFQPTDETGQNEKIGKRPRNSSDRFLSCSDDKVAQRCLENTHHKNQVRVDGLANETVKSFSQDLAFAPKRTKRRNPLKLKLTPPGAPFSHKRSFCTGTDSALYDKFLPCSHAFRRSFSRESGGPSSTEDSKSKTYDVAMKIRKHLAAGSSLQHLKTVQDFEAEPPKDRVERILGYRLTNFDEMSLDIACGILKKAVIYDEHDVLAINKPYGLATHAGVGSRVTVASILPELRKRLGSTMGESKLHIVHRLDKYTSGILLLAKSSRTAEKLSDMFAEHKVIRRYWAIVRGVPQSPVAVIDMPIGEMELKGRYKMTVVPERSSENTKELIKTSSLGRDTAKRALTYYQIISAGPSYAFLHCQPYTGLKHQIRVHLAQALCTPILGDHKYSSMLESKPQKLPESMLKRLRIRQQETRLLPMHLHSRVLVLPQFTANGENIIMTAKPPYFFDRALTRLKLRARLTT